MNTKRLRKEFIKQHKGRPIVSFLNIKIESIEESDSKPTITEKDIESKIIDLTDESTASIKLITKSPSFPKIEKQKRKRLFFWRRKPKIKPEKTEEVDEIKINLSKERTDDLLKEIYSISEESDDEIRTLVSLSDELDNGACIDVEKIIKAIPPMSRRIVDVKFLNIDHFDVVCDAVEHILKIGTEDPVEDTRLKYNILNDIYRKVINSFDSTNPTLYRFITILSKLILKESDSPIRIDSSPIIIDFIPSKIFEQTKIYTELFPKTGIKIKSLSKESRELLKKKILYMRSHSEMYNKKFSYIDTIMRYFENQTTDPDPRARNIWSNFFYYYISNLK